MEYRGYDSWGVAYPEGEQLIVRKAVGGLDGGANFEIDSSPQIAIGHKRWATHGGVTDTNAHPHFSTDRRFALAQNGIVENYQELKQELLANGFEFISQTDTEVIVRLIEQELQSAPDLETAVRQAFQKLEGRNTIILLDKAQDKIMAIRNGSPLVIGIDGDEYYLASDTLAFANYAKDFVVVDNSQMVELTAGNLQLSHVVTAEPIAFQPQPLDLQQIDVDKEGYNHYMLKEIVEQQFTIKQAIQYTEEELQPLVDAVKAAHQVYTLGAGTAGFAAAQIAYSLRCYAQIPAIELKSYEVGSYAELFRPDDLVIVVSQSGETADTIEAVEIAQAKGAQIASIVNMIGSSLSRMSDFAFLSRTGPEICVASTKAYTAQVAWGLLLSQTIAGNYVAAKQNIYEAAEALSAFFVPETFKHIKQMVQTLKSKEHFFILGKGQNYYVSLEGALKVKEITYKHFEGFPAGELKHGVIALVEKGTPVFVIVSNDANRRDLISAAAEVKSRGAYVIGIAKDNNEVFDAYVQTPDMGIADPLMNVIPFQLLSYFMAVELGNSPDKPRNLAKSVTVK